MKRILVLLTLCFLCNVVLADHIKIMTYNILVGFSDHPEFKKKYIDWVSKEDLDVIAYQETATFDTTTFAAFAKSYGHNYTYFQPTTGCCPIAISSKRPMKVLISTEVSVHHGFLVAEIDGIKVSVLHLNPYSYKERQKEIKQITDTLAARFGNDKQVLLGDFNSFSIRDQSLYKEEENRRKKGSNHNDNVLADGSFDYSISQYMLDHKYIDTYRFLNDDFGSTYPTRLFSNGKSTFYRRIDFIYASANMQGDLVSCKVPKDNITGLISDHYPVILTVKK